MRAFLVMAALAFAMSPAVAQTSAPVRIKIEPASSATRAIQPVEPGDTTPPVILVYEPATTRGIRLRLKTRSLKVRGRIRDESPISFVTVNDRPVDLDVDGYFVIDLPVVIGASEVNIVAQDSAGNVETKSIELERSLDVQITGKYYALVIGIDDYEGQWDALENSVNDAESVAELLEAEYRFDHVYLMRNGEATRRTIMSRMRSLQRELTENDKLLIYYAGHGYLDKAFNTGYWVPSGALSADVADFIPNDVIKTWVRGFKSKHTLLIADACFAGDLTRSGPSERGYAAGSPEFYQDLHDHKSRRVITAGGIQPVWDSGVSEDHSLFAFFFLQALQENKEPYIDASMVFARLKPNVVNNSQLDQAGKRQIPAYSVIAGSGDAGGEFVFVRR